MSISSLSQAPPPLSLSCCRLGPVIFFIDVTYGDIFGDCNPLSSGEFIASINVVHNTPKILLMVF